MYSLTYWLNFTAGLKNLSLNRQNTFIVWHLCLEEEGVWGKILNAESTSLDGDGHRIPGEQGIRAKGPLELVNLAFRTTDGACRSGTCRAPGSAGAWREGSPCRSPASAFMIPRS